MSTEKLLEAARNAFPAASDETLKSYPLSRFTKKDELPKFLDTTDPSIVKKIARFYSGITISELEDTIKDFPSLRKEQILRFFQSESLASNNVILSSTYITRPALITLVEVLEDYTGRRLLDASDAPLAYLDALDDKLTVGDLADFFAGYPDNRIAGILAAKYNPARPPKTKVSLKVTKHPRATVKHYLAECLELPNVSALNENLPITELTTSLIEGEKAYYVIIHWLEARFKSTIPNDFVESKTVGELIDLLSK